LLDWVGDDRPGASRWEAKRPRFPALVTII